MKNTFKLPTRNKIFDVRQHNGVFLKLLQSLETPYNDYEESFYKLLESFVINNVEFELFTLTDEKIINWPNMIFSTTKRSNCVDNAYVAHSLGKYLNFPGRIIAYGGFNHFNPVSHLEHFIFIIIDHRILMNPKASKNARPYILWNKPDSSLGDIDLRFKTFDFIIKNLNAIVNYKIYGNNKYLSIQSVFDPMTFALTWQDIVVLENNFNTPNMTHAELFKKMPIFGVEYNDYKNRKAKRFDEVMKMAKFGKRLNESENNDEAVFAKINELFEKEHENTKKALTEAGIEIKDPENMTPGNIITSSFKQGIQEFGSQEAFEDHIEHLTDEFEKLIAQTSLAEGYFARRKRCQEAIDNDPILSSHDFTYINGKPIRIN